jgi:alkylhydroperoxidase/carboxymuconolactone decarboxylase family protein YurZ
MSKIISDDILQITKQRKNLEFELREVLPTYQDHTNLITKVLGEEYLRKGGLSQTNRMLVALGVAVNSGNESMIEFCVTRALNHGGTEQGILDVLDVSMLTGGGTVVAGVRFAYNTLKFRIQNPESSDQFLREAKEMHTG